MFIWLYRASLRIEIVVKHLGLLTIFKIWDLKTKTRLTATKFAIGQQKVHKLLHFRTRK